MTKFIQYINENSLTPDHKKIIDKISQWKSDLRKMTKLFNSLKDSDDKKDIKAWTDLIKYFNTFGDNFEKFIQYLFQKEKNDENWYEEQARKKAWEARSDIYSVVKDGYDMYIEKHGIDINRTLKERDKIISRYNRLFREAFKAIEEMIQNESEDLKRKELFSSFNYAGVRVELEYNKELNNDSYSYKGMVKFLKNLKSMLTVIEKKGLKILLKNLKINLTLGTNVGNAAGRYDLGTDAVIMTPWGLAGSESEYTFYHETGHRYWYKFMPKKQRERWESVISDTKINITDKHINDFINKYFPFDKVVGIKDHNVNIEDYRNFFMINKEPTENISVFSYFIENFPYHLKKGIKNGDVDKETVKNEMKQTLLGTKISSQLISNYANKNVEEAWSESIAIWLKYGINRLPEKIRYVFKNMFFDMGIKINENLLNEEEKENDQD